MSLQKGFDDSTFGLIGGSWRPRRLTRGQRDSQPPLFDGSRSGGVLPTVMFCASRGAIPHDASHTTHTTAVTHRLRGFC